MDGEVGMLLARVEALEAKVGMKEAEAEAGNGEVAAEAPGLPLVPIGGETQGAFRWEGDKITNCHFYAAHAIYTLADVTVEEGQADGTWYLNVSHPASGSVTGSVSKSEGSNDDENTCVKLFEIEDGQVKKDYRGMPFIPIYA